MPDALYRVTFFADDRRQSLRAARRFVTSIAGGLSLEQGENILVNGAIYVVVFGQRDAIDVALISARLEGVAVDVAETVATEGHECVNCGNKADEPFVRCPACDFQETSACPVCETETPRTGYPAAEGRLVTCPVCKARVRLAYAEPMWKKDGTYAEPLIVVRRA